MNSTNLKILEEAEKLFAERGVSKTSIHVLAKACNVRVSNIYHYYANKDEILFAILERNLEKQLSEAKTHLYGITTPIARLEKYIWTLFYQAQINRNHSKLILLEFRHHRELIKTSAYKYLREMVNLPIPILLEGQEEGIFRPDIDSITFRNLIQGILEAFTRNWLIFNKPENILDYVPIATKIILAGIANPPREPGANVFPKK